MINRLLVIMVAVVFCLSGITGAALAADAKKAAPKAPAVAKAMPPRANVGMISGKVTAINSSDPANIRIEVMNEADNTTHTLTVMPQTNITKVTDISELKVGDSVRVMSRKTDDKEVAMGLMFGNIKPIPRPRPVTPGTTPPAKLKESPKK